MKRNYTIKQLTYFTMTLSCLFLLCSGIANADDPCSIKGMSSIPGQVTQQIYQALNLSSSQAESISEISNNTVETIQTWHEKQKAKRESLIATVRLAAEDKMISRSEKRDIKLASGQLQAGRKELFSILSQGVRDIDNVLTEDQKEALDDLIIYVTVPDDVKEALAELKTVLDLTVTEYNETEEISESSKEELEAALQLLMETLYMPDKVREVMNDHTFQSPEGLMNLTPFQDNILNIDIENIHKAVSNIVENLMEEPVTLEELLESIERFSVIGNKLAVISKFAKLSFMETVMLTPIFNCQLQ